MVADRKIKVLVVDDSALMRQLLTALLHQDNEIQVVGTAADPFIAREKIKHLRPDVITLDVEMPGMDGITFLEKLMRLHPMPVVMVSSLTEQGAQTTVRALELGAIDFVTKPREDLRNNMHTIGEELCDKVRMAAQAHVRMHAENLPQLAEPAPQMSGSVARIVAIGASAGGTQAIGEILSVLPHDSPGIAVVQHMPPKFTKLFAEHLNDHSQLTVREAQDGDRLQRGTVLIAPGGKQMAVRQVDNGFAVRVYEGAPVNLHQPAVDVLFDSVAKCAGIDALGILLTGMGADGAKGLLNLKLAGAHTIAQDAATSVIFGMPDQAIKLGAAREVMALDRIARRIMSWSSDDDAVAANAR